MKKSSLFFCLLSLFAYAFLFGCAAAPTLPSAAVAGPAATPEANSPAANVWYQLEEYQPLAEGFTWTYQWLLSSSAGDRNFTTVSTCQAPLSANNRRIWPIRTQVQGGGAQNSEYIEYMSIDDQGLLILQPEHPLRPRFTAATSSFYLIKKPLRPGNRWSAAADAFLFYQLPVQQQADIAVDIEYMIDSLTQAVTVPAGTFSSCLVVRTRVAASVNAPGAPERAGFTIDVFTEYGPGVGMVQMKMSLESVTIPSLQMKMSRQLLSFKKP